MEQRQIAHTSPENRAQEKSLILHEDKFQAQTQRTEHRSKLLIQHKDKMHAQTRRTEHRSKLLLLHEEVWQENNLVFWRMRH
jgi:hypothetical protein